MTVPELNAGLIGGILGRAVECEEGRMVLRAEAFVDSAVRGTLGFLADQNWIKETGLRTWTVTRRGRFWYACLSRSDSLMFHEYGRVVFLLHVVRSGPETIVWHKGRFATIAVADLGWPEYFEVRRENELVPIPAGSHMDEALAAACALLADDLEARQAPMRRELWKHMLEFAERR